MGEHQPALAVPTRHTGKKRAVAPPGLGPRVRGSEVHPTRGQCSGLLSITQKSLYL